MIRTIYWLIEELDEFRRDRDTALEHSVKKRLEESFNAYERELMSSIRYLSSVDAKNILSRIIKE